MARLNKEDFLTDGRKQAANVISSGQPYVWAYEECRGCPAISLENMTECAYYFLNCHEFSKQVNEIAKAPTEENAKALREWFVETMSNYIADAEWLAYDA